jgi:Derlin-2/3
MTLLITLGLVNPMYLYYTFQTAIMEFNIWRPFTALFYMGKFSFGMIFNLYFAFIAISKVETMVFTRDKYADFLWLNVLIFLGCVLVGSVLDIYFFSEVYQMTMIYIWCKRFPHEEITLMFGFRVKSKCFPMQLGTSPSSTPS